MAQNPSNPRCFLSASILISCSLTFFGETARKNSLETLGGEWMEDAPRSQVTPNSRLLAVWKKLRTRAETPIFQFEKRNILKLNINAAQPRNVPRNTIDPRKHARKYGQANGQANLTHRAPWLMHRDQGPAYLAESTGSIGQPIWVTKNTNKTMSVSRLQKGPKKCIKQHQNWQQPASSYWCQT